MIATAALVLVAAAGLLAVRSAPPPARWLAWGLVLAFALASLDPLRVSFGPTAPRPASVVATRNSVALLGAAAVAGPRAVDLTLGWSEALASSPGVGPLGAWGRLPRAPLPVDPRRVQVRVLGEVAAGRPLLLQVEAPGLGAAAGELLLRRGSEVVERQSIALDERGVAQCSWLPDAAGELIVTCELRAFGHRLHGEGALAIGAPPRVLVVEPSGTVAAALTAQGLSVDSRDQLPADWRQSAAVVLGRALADDLQNELVSAVQDGLGAFVLAPAFGGEGAPLRALLPLRPRPEPSDAAGGTQPSPTEPAPEPGPAPDADPRPPSGGTAGAAPIGRDPIEVDKRAIAMVLVVDRSFSMGSLLPNGRTKMSYAKTSALRTAQALTVGDRVALVTFGSKNQGRVELPLTDATDLTRVRAGIERLAHAAEQTFLLSGLRLADGLLTETNAAVKHVVVLTDGEFRREEALAMQDLARRMRVERRATVSMISIIDRDSDPAWKGEAEVLTRLGGGQFFAIEDPTFVPTLVSAEVTRALERVGREPADGGNDPTAPPSPKPSEPPPAAPVPEPTTARLAVRAVAPSALLLPETAAWPTLGGAVPGTAPLDAEVLLVAGEAGWPLLAFANRGLGRVGAFAADLGGPDGAAFRADAAFPGWLAQWVQAVLRAVPPRQSPPLLGPVRVEPTAPTQRDVEWLTALAGAPPRVEPPPAPPATRREVASEAPQWSLALLLLLVLLALCERYAGLWSLQRTG